METFDGEEEISESCQEKYLGQIISSDGSNAKNVANRAGKGSGMANTIESIIKYLPGGRFHFEIAIIMRNAYLVSSMLSCSEVWYDVTESDMRKLEQTDELMLRNIFDCSSQVTCEILYLELGLLPARYIIKLRRIIYFQHILKQRRKNTLLYQFLIAQIEEPKKNDWVSCIRKDMVELEIQMNSDEIEEMNIEKFKNMCKEKSCQEGLQIFRK